MLTLLLIAMGSALRAQYYESAKWDHWSRKYFPNDTNIVVKEFKDERAPILIKGKDPYHFKNNRAGFIDSNGRVVIKPIYVDVSEFRDGLALVVDTLGKRGLINTMGHPVIPVIYDGIDCFDNGLVFIYLKGKMGLMTSIGRLILPPTKYTHHAFPPPIYNGEANDMVYGGFRWEPLIFSKAWYFKKFIAVRSGQKWGVINEQGREVVPPLFDCIGIFNNGLATAAIDKKAGVINGRGKLIVPAVYDDVTIDGAYIFAKRNDSVEVRNYNGKMLIPLRQASDISALKPGAFLLTDKDRKRGVMNKAGQVIIPVVNNVLLKFGSGFYAERSNDSAVVYDKMGKRLTDFGYAIYVRDGTCILRGFNKPDSFMVYNRQKDDFIIYHELEYNYKDRSTAAVMTYGRDGKKGLLNAAGAELTPAIYEEIYEAMPGPADLYNSPKTYMAKLGIKWGMLDHTGKTLLKFEFDNLYERQEYILASKGKKMGFIAKPIKRLTPIKYDDVNVNGSDALQKTISVKVGSYWGFINKQGKEITPFKYSTVYSFSTALGVVGVNNKYGVINTLGKEILPCVYDTYPIINANYIIAQKDKLFWVFDPDGKLMRPSGYDLISETHSYRDTKDVKTWLVLKKGNKVGLINSMGKTVLDEKYSFVSLLHDRYFIAGLKDQTGLLDLNGKLLLPFEYQMIDVVEKAYKQDRDVFTATVNSKMGVVGLDQKVLIPFAYDGVLYLDTERPVAKSGSFYGLINWSGSSVTPFIYSEIQHPWNNRYIVRVNEKAGALSLTGEQILPPVYDYVYNTSPAAMIIIKDNRYGLADSTGKVLIAPYYDGMDHCGKGTIKVRKGDLYGLIDQTGRVIYPCKYILLNCVDGRVLEMH